MLFSFSSAKIKKLKPCYECCKMTKGSYRQRVIVHSNVQDKQMVFHKLPVNEEGQKAWALPVNEERQKVWEHAVSKGKEDFEKLKHFKVCLNHFLERKPSKCNPDPTLSFKIL